MVKALVVPLGTHLCPKGSGQNSERLTGEEKVARVSPTCSQGHQGVNPRPLGTAQDMPCGAQHLRCAHEDKLDRGAARVGISSKG